MNAPALEDFCWDPAGWLVNAYRSSLRPRLLAPSVLAASAVVLPGGGHRRVHGRRHHTTLTSPQSFVASQVTPSLLMVDSAEGRRTSAWICHASALTSVNFAIKHWSGSL